MRLLNSTSSQTKAEPRAHLIEWQHLFLSTMIPHQRQRFLAGTAWEEQPSVCSFDAAVSHSTCGANVTACGDAAHLTASSTLGCSQSKW